MTDLSATHEGVVLNNITSGNVYVALHTGDEGDDPDGTSEVTAGDYSRLEILEANLTVSTSTSGPSDVTNDNEEEFTDSADNAWGNVTHFSFWDSQIDGAPYTATVSLDSSADITTGERVYVASGGLTLELD